MRNSAMRIVNMCEVSAKINAAKTSAKANSFLE